MNRRALWLIALLMLCGYQAVQWWQLRPVMQIAGVLAADEPKQSETAASAFPHKGFTLQPRASYRITARVLSREAYRMGREARLSPLDFALGWGVMSNSSVVDALEISQSGRFFWLRWSDAPPAPEAELMRHAANTHLIPADSGVGRQLAKIRPGQVVQLQGLLVDARAADGWQWQTSLVREDSGAGACELFWVQSVEVVLSGQ
ncbi:MAG: hypothetical protein V4650_02650 [Pseudomonadota bacterium]